MNKAELKALTTRLDPILSPFDRAAGKIYNEFARPKNLGLSMPPHSVENEAFLSLHMLFDSDPETTPIVFATMSALLLDFSEDYTTAFMDFQADKDTPKFDEAKAIVDWVIELMQQETIRAMAQFAGVQVIDMQKWKEGDPIPPGYQLMLLQETEDGLTLDTYGGEPDDSTSNG